MDVKAYEKLKTEAGSVVQKYLNHQPVTAEEKKVLGQLRAAKESIYGIKRKDAVIRADIRKYIPYDFTAEDRYANHLRLIVGFLVGKVVKKDVAYAAKHGKKLVWGAADAEVATAKKAKAKPVDKKE
jgi:hypothetical protein